MRSTRAISHVLTDWPKLRTAREILRKKIGTRPNSLSLGGKPHRLPTGHTEWKISKKDLEAILDFAEETAI